MFMLRTCMCVYSGRTETTGLCYYMIISSYMMLFVFSVDNWFSINCTDPHQRHSPLFTFTFVFDLLLYKPPTVTELLSINMILHHQDLTKGRAP